MRSAILLSALLLCRYHNPSLGMPDSLLWFVTVALFIFFLMDVSEWWRRL